MKILWTKHKLLSLFSSVSACPLTQSKTFPPMFHLSSCWLTVCYAYVKYGCAATSMKKIQKLSVEETANILQGLSRSGYMLKNSWNHQNTVINISFTRSKLFVSKTSKYGERKNQSNVWLCKGNFSDRIWESDQLSVSLPLVKLDQPIRSVSSW